MTSPIVAIPQRVLAASSAFNSSATLPPRAHLVKGLGFRNVQGYLTHKKLPPSKGVHRFLGVVLL